MDRRCFALAVILIGCSSNSSSPLGLKSDANTPDAIVLPKIDASRAHDAKAEAARDAGRGASDALPSSNDAEAGVSYPAPHPPMPQVINLGGPVMSSPKFVVITFAGDALAPSIDDFVDKVAASGTYWSGTTAEYGVGPIASVLHLSLNETPMANLADSDVQNWITAKLSSSDGGAPEAGTHEAGTKEAGTREAGAHEGGALEGGAPWPQPDGETVYLIYYPDNVTITQGGQTSCNGFYGYHGDYLLSGSTYVTYSVVARCPSFPGTTAIDSIASIASHEMIEAVTDPRVIDKPAWATADANHTAWAIPAGGELGDMCAGFGNVFYKPSDVPYLVQRSWSNKAAAAGHDPCQPDGAMPYFNAAAVLNDTVTVQDPTLGTYTTKGVKIPVGGTGTVELDLYSDGPAPPWSVQAFDLSSLFGGTQELAVTIGNQPSASGANGDKLTLSIKVLQEGTGGAEILWIQSGDGASPPVWLGVVGN